jgi:uncharacterized protein (TIGR03067 family)
MLGPVLFLLATSALPPGQALATKEQTDRDLLQGTWRVVATQSAIKDSNEMKVTQVAFRGGQIVFTIAGRQGSEEARCKIDSSKSPKWIDFEIRIFDKSIWVEGIYAVDRGNLSLCFASGDRKRPTKLDTLPGSGCVLLKLERVKK